MENSQELIDYLFFKEDKELLFMASIIRLILDDRGVSYVGRSSDLEEDQMQRVFKRLSFSGWNYYKDMLMYIVPISKSEYCKIKENNKVESAKDKAYLDELRHK